MYKLTHLLHLAGDPDTAPAAKILDDLRAVVGGPARRSVVGRTLPGSRNGGDILMHLQFDDESQWEAIRPRVTAIESSEAVTHVDGAGYRGGQTGAASPRAAGSVYRTLLLRVDPDAPESAVDGFEAALLSMPRYIDSIRAWRLSRVSHAVGTSRWTHVWEQEFSDLNGLAGPYLMHPVHWACVDRWFDPECPECIIHDRVCHSLCGCEGPVLG